MEGIADAAAKMELMFHRALDTLPCDSFTPESKQRCDLCEVQSKGSSHRATIRFPPTSPLRKSVQSDWHDDAHSAKLQAFSKALDDIKKAGMLSGEVQDLVETTEQAPNADPATTAGRALVIPGGAPRASAAGGGSQLLAASVGARAPMSTAPPNIDLDLGSVACGQWPEELFVLRLDVELDAGGGLELAPGTGGFGLLVDPTCADFGVTLNLQDGTMPELRGTVQLRPVRVRLPGARESAQRTEAMELVRRHHEATLYALRPGLRPSFGGVGLSSHDSAESSDEVEKPHFAESLSTSALVVRLEDSAEHFGTSDTGQFAWAAMQQFVDDDVTKFVLQAMSLEEDCENGEGGGEGSGRGCKEKGAPMVPPHLFYHHAAAVDATAATPGVDADGPTLPLWLLPVLYRVFRFLELRQHMVGSPAGAAPWHPLLLDMAMTLPSAGVRQGPFETLHHLGSKVLGAILSIVAYVQHPPVDCAQLERSRTAACRTEVLAGVAKDLPIHAMALSSCPDLMAWRPPGVPCVRKSVLERGGGGPRAVKVPARIRMKRRSISSRPSRPPTSCSSRAASPPPRAS